MAGGVSSGIVRRMQKLPELVVFDLAGTTVEDLGQVPAAFAEAIQAQGVSASPAAIEEIRGASKREAFSRLLPPGPDHAERIDAAYRTFQEALAARYAATGIQEIAGAERTFAWLREHGIRVALNTGFDRATTAMLLEPLGWSGSVEAVVCVDDVARGRPAPDLIERAIAVAGASSPAAVANVGDTTLDLEAAQRAGVGWSFGVLSGAHRRERLERFPHTALLPSVADLPAFLERP